MDQRNQQDCYGSTPDCAPVRTSRCSRCKSEGPYHGKAAFLCDRCKETCRDCDQVVELVPTRSYCRECWNRRRRDHRKEHPEKYVDGQRRRSQKYAADETLRIVARQRTKEWNKNNARRRKDSALRKTYNITLDDYEVRLRNQNNGCNACHDSNPGGGRKYFSVDHDHSCCPGKTSCGKCVRGLLCSRCNLALGRFDESIALLYALAHYLEDWDQKKPPTEGGVDADYRLTATAA